MKVYRKSDFGIGLAFLILCIAYFIMADQLPPSKMMDVGPDFMPKVYACIAGGLSVILMIGSFKPYREEDMDESAVKSEYNLVLMSFLLLILYVMLLDLVGFIIMTIFYLFCQMMVLAPKEKRNPVLFGVIAVTCSFVIFFVFRRAFEIQLPLGILPFIR